MYFFIEVVWLVYKIWFSTWTDTSVAAVISIYFYTLISNISNKM
jgi:hypothetical protein